MSKPFIYHSYKISKVLKLLIFIIDIKHEKLPLTAPGAGAVRPPDAFQARSIGAEQDGPGNLSG